MVKSKNKYMWSDNINNAPILEVHTGIKHSIIRDYIRNYLKVVASPHASHVKLSIVDGFCGGGLYNNGNNPHFGTPIIILQALKDIFVELLAERALNNIKRELTLECNVYFIDKDKKAIEVLKSVSAPFLITDVALPLKINPYFIEAEFSKVYKEILSKSGKSKAIFLLDPCGYSEVTVPIIKDIMSSQKREVIWTFMIDAMKAFATDDSQSLINSGFEDLLKLFNKESELTGFCVQRAIFDITKNNIGVPFFTPFAIKQKIGWNYWLIHLAHHYRASEVMKEVEHRHADQREHYGESGLNMMAAAGDGVYLFREEDIDKGYRKLQEDIPQLLAKPEFKNGVSFGKFMELTYNETPLVSSIIRDTLVKHADIEIFTSEKGARTSAKRIKTGDHIQLKRQTRMFF